MEALSSHAWLTSDSARLMYGCVAVRTARRAIMVMPTVVVVKTAKSRRRKRMASRRR